MRPWMFVSLAVACVTPVERDPRRDAAWGTPASPSGDSASTSTPVGGASTEGAGVAEAEGFVPPKRLQLRGRVILDELGSVVQLRGGNLKGATPDEVAAFTDRHQMNFARLPVEWKSDNWVDPAEPSAFHSDYLEEVQAWVDALEAEGVWFVLEMRVDDEIAKSAELYDPTSLLYAEFEAAWVSLAQRFAADDYVAGYGLLAEPSTGAVEGEQWEALTTFQRALMDRITDPVAGAGDSWTPFFVGPAFNYDTMQYRYDGYADALAAYHGRLVYEVNVLTPKPWIQDGLGPDGSPVSYPQPAPPDFDALLTVAPGEEYELPRDMERVIKQRLEEPENFVTALNQEFLTWYLQWPVAFSLRHDVPIYVDQFGADVGAAGQLTYERDLIEVLERLDVPWTRWGYTAGSDGRKIVDNPFVDAMYTDLGARAAAGELVVWEADADELVRIEASSYGLATAGTTHTWRFYDATNDLGRGAVQALPTTGGPMGTATAPRLDYRVNLPRSGTWYVWTRMRGGTAQAGLWLGVDGVASPAQVASPTPTRWTWVRAQGPVPTDGLHTLNLWMNRPGVMVDEVVLTPSADWVPPAELADGAPRSLDLQAPPQP